jgi:exodeoxyribonuclease V beta subunit
VLVAAEISRLLQSGACLRLGAEDTPVGPGDVAVLCRTNQQAKLTHEALRALGVPAVLYGDSSVFDTDDALDVERVLRAMAEPGDAAALRAALVTTLVGFGGEELDQLRDDARAFDQVVARFVELSETWRSSGFVAAFRRMLQDHGVEARLLGRIDGERRLTNVLHLGELLQNAAVAGHRGPFALVEWLHRVRHDSAARDEVAADSAQIRLESDSLRVKLTTVHQAKGLEYPIVYCPFLWTKIWDASEAGFSFHDPDAANERRFDVGSIERARHETLYRREELAESVRLLYVALTRARHRCSIVWGRFAEGGSSALGYLLHRAADLGPNHDVAETLRAIQERLGSAESFHADLERIVASAPGAIRVRDLPSDPVAPYLGAPEVAEITAPKRALRVIDDRWRTSSFTRLAAGGGRISAVAEQGVDHDESEEQPAITAAAPAAELPIALHDLPKGARSGELLHEILEHLDFTASLSEIETAVAEALVVHGFDADPWRQRVAEAVADVLGTPLGGGAGSLRLRDVAKDRRISEMEFTLPIADGGARSALTSERLAALFRKHGAPPGRPGYAERLERLRFAALTGFLRGFVDLVFEHAGRWYVIDWKSNFLGAVASGYAPPRLAGAMDGHHYYLQYHLYAVALDRHLRARLPRYDRSRHFGGVYYLFLRGMSQRHPEGTGIFHDRPTDELVADLSALLSGAAGSPRERRR